MDWIGLAPGLQRTEAKLELDKQTHSHKAFTQAGPAGLSRFAGASSPAPAKETKSPCAPRLE